MTLTDFGAVVEALMVTAYVGVAPAEAVLDAIDKAGEKINAAMPDPGRWGTSPTQVRSAAKAEAMFGPG